MFIFKQEGYISIRKTTVNHGTDITVIQVLGHEQSHHQAKSY